MEESDGVSSTQTTAGSDTAEEERDIRAMPFVTTLSFVRSVKGNPDVLCLQRLQVLAENENWDLRDHRQQATRV
jgi:hypothetical protein